MLLEHRGAQPTVHPSAYVAPTAVVCGDVRVGPGARVLFGAVVTAEDGLVEIGYHAIHPTVAGQAYLEGPTVFYQWHRETFEIPRGAVHLAHNEAFDGQAFRYNDHIYGLEFHPEMTPAILAAWFETGATLDIDRFGLDGSALQGQTRACDPVNRERAHRLVDAFLDRVATGAAAEAMQ